MVEVSVLSTTRCDRRDPRLAALVVRRIACPRMRSLSGRLQTLGLSRTAPQISPGSRRSLPPTQWASKGRALPSPRSRRARSAGRALRRLGLAECLLRVGGCPVLGLAERLLRVGLPSEFSESIKSGNSSPADRVRAGAPGAGNGSRLIGCRAGLLSVPDFLEPPVTGRASVRGWASCTTRRSRAPLLPLRQRSRSPVSQRFR